VRRLARGNETVFGEKTIEAVPSSPRSRSVDRARALRARAHAVVERGAAMVAAELGMKVDVGRPQRAAGEAQATEVAVE
jgi:hypothetical protein